MRPIKSGVVLFTIGVLIALSLPVAYCAQAHFGYRQRDGYYEGVWNERPISGIDLRLVSVCVVTDVGTASRSSADTGYLYLAFVAPKDFDALDIEIRGPGNYLLDRVDREFKPGFNVFAWKSRVIGGLGIHLEELEPLVSVVGGANIPCFLYALEPTGMPPVTGLRVLFQANVEGNMKYFVRDGGKLVVDDVVPVSANVPAEARLPGTVASGYMDLIAVLEYQTNGGLRSVRQCFPIQVLHGAGGHGRGS